MEQIGIHAARAAEGQHQAARRQQPDQVGHPIGMPGAGGVVADGPVPALAIDHRKQLEDLAGEATDRIPAFKRLAVQAAVEVAGADFCNVEGHHAGQPLQRGRIAMRAEGGAVLAKDSASIPATQLFRTGGDSTVRGYGLRDIGIQLPNGATGPGRYLAVGSVEWQRPILRGGLPSEWEHTLFVDAGAVADKPQNLRPSVGVGTGVRWRSPIGPLQADVAYGVKVKQLRLHLSVGFVF